MKILIDENGVVRAWQVVGGGFNNTEYTTVEVNEIPEEVKEHSEKYCYIDGNYIDNPAYAPIELENTKKDKVQELSDTCTQIIYAGCDVQVSDNTVQHFTLDEQDQLNLSGIGLKIAMGATTVAWHEDDETSPCMFYSAEEATKIIGTLTVFKEYHITYFRDLRIYVNSLSDIEEIKTIQYGFALPEEYKSEVLKEYERQLTNA